MMRRKQEKSISGMKKMERAKMSMGTLIAVPGFLRKAVTSTMNSIPHNTDKQKCLPLTFHSTSLS